MLSSGAATLENTLAPQKTKCTYHMTQYGHTGSTAGHISKRCCLCKNLYTQVSRSNTPHKKANNANNPNTCQLMNV